MKPNALLPLFALPAIWLAAPAPAPASTAVSDAPPAAQAAALIAKNDLAAAEALLLPLTEPSATPTSPTSAPTPDTAAAFFQLGQLRTKQKRLDDAIAAFERASALDPTRADHFSSLAIALGAKLQLPGPLATKAALAPKLQRAFAKSVELDPKHLPGLIGLARFYANAPEIAGGSLERAKDFAQRVHAVHPLLGELELAHVAERAEDPATAITSYEAALKLAPNHPAARAALTRLRSVTELP